MSSTPCPTCGRDDFSDDSYMKKHHSMAHDESISGFTTTCTYCGDTIIKDVKEHAEGRSFCDQECMGDWRSEQTGEDAMNWQGGIEPRTCPICGTTHTPKQSSVRTCSDECYRKRQSELTSGHKNPRWNGGHDEWYGSTWPEKRQEIRERDDNTCQNCRDSFDYNIPVHHIIPVREFDDPNDAHFDENMIQLCRTCHPKLEVLEPAEQRERLALEEA